MDFLDIFSTQNNCLVIDFQKDIEIFAFGLNLCLWQLFKEGTCLKKGDSNDVS